jgi:hypothetical protein
VTLGPAEIHPQEHLRPVGGFGAAGARADREKGRPLVVLPGEEQRRPLPPEVCLERRGITLELGLELGVGGFLEQLDRSKQVVGASRQISPGGCFAPNAVGFAEDLLRGSAVVPETRLLGLGLDLCDSGFLGL